MRPLIIILALVSSLHAQLNISLKPVKSQFVAYEDIAVEISITNRSGRTLFFKGAKRSNWLDFDITDQHGDLLPYNGEPPVYQALELHAGQTLKRKITISNSYDLTRYGKYRVSAYVKLPGQDGMALKSQSSSFLVSNGRVLYNQSIGMSQNNTARTYQVMVFNGSERSDIYTKIIDSDTKQVYSCQPLSQVIMTKTPSAALDANNNLHLLYLITQLTYTHVVVDPTGKIIKRSYHKPGAVNDPSLLSFADGSVTVTGSIPFDPFAQQKKKATERKLSDRPGNF